MNDDEKENAEMLFWSFFAGNSIRGLEAHYHP